MKDTARAHPGQPAVAEQPGTAPEPAAGTAPEPAAEAAVDVVSGPAGAGPADRQPRARSLLRRCWPPALIILAGLGLWELIVRLAHVPAYLLPAPSAIAADLATDWPVLEPALVVTLQEVLLGFVIAAVAGVGLAVALHLSPVARRAVYPLLIGSQTLPIIVLAPILV